MPQDSPDAQLIRELEQRTRELTLLHRAGVQLTRATHTDDVTRTLYRIISELMDCDSLLISSYDREEKLIRALFVLHEGEVADVSQFPPLPFDVDAPLPKGTGTQGFALRTGQSLLINDYVTYAMKQTAYYYEDGQVHAADPDEDDSEVITTRAALIVPLKLNAQVTGVVQVFSYRQDAYRPEHLRFMEAVAPQAAIAIKNTRLIARLEGRVEQRTVQLEQAQQQAEAILQSTSDGIVLLDADGSIVHANDTFCTMLDCRLTQAVGVALRSFMMQTCDLTLQADTSVECDLRRTTGGMFPAELRFTALRGQTDLAWVCTVRDITRRKQVEAELKQALEHERAAGELRMRLVSMVSHEFRTPLASILLSAENLDRYKDKLTDERRTEYVERIRSQVKHLGKLVEDVLVVGRADTVGLTLRREPTALDALVAQVVAEIAALSPQHRISLNLPDAVPQVALDVSLMRQVLVNLLSNAVKYSPDLQPISVALVQQDGSLRLTVADSGIGISPEDLPHLFQPFQRATNVGSIQGTGLGLSIVKRAVEAHGGTITLESTPGKGTTVTLTLSLV